MLCRPGFIIICLRRSNHKWIALLSFYLGVNEPKMLWSPVTGDTWGVQGHMWPHPLNNVNANEGTSKDHLITWHPLPEHNKLFHSFISNWRYFTFSNDWDLTSVYSLCLAHSQAQTLLTCWTCWRAVHSCLFVYEIVYSESLSLKTHVEMQSKARCEKVLLNSECY